MQHIEKPKLKSSVKIKTSPLVSILKSDKQLAEDSEKHSLFLTLAALFDEDLKANLYLTSFDLDDKYQTGAPHDWLVFLNYIAVRKYVDQFIEDQQSADARKQLKEVGFEKSRDALTAQQQIDARRASKNNNNIVVFVLPPKKYWGVDD